MAQSVQLAPLYQQYRKAVAAVDTLPVTDVKEACNAGQHEDVHVQVFPAGGANPTVAVLWWSEAAGKFIQEHVAISKAGVGANTPFEFTIQAKGRMFFVAVTTLAAGTVDIYVSGFGLNNLV